MDFHWDGVPGNEASIVILAAPGTDFSFVHKIRMAAIRDGQVIQLMDENVIGSLYMTKYSPGRDYRWVPNAATAADLSTFTSEEGAFDYATSFWVQDYIGKVALPEQTRWHHVHVKPRVWKVVADKMVTVSESDGIVDTGIDFQLGDKYELQGFGKIWAGIQGDPDNGPEGYSNIDNDPKFPLYQGREAHPYALIGRFGTEENWFLVGDYLLKVYVTDSIQRLYLRTNDDWPGNGSGAFECRVRCLRFEEQ